MSYDEATGKIAFDVSGLKTRTNRKGEVTIKGADLDFMNKLVNGESRLLYENAETMTIQSGFVNIVGSADGYETAELTRLTNQTIPTNDFPDKVYSITPASSVESGNWHSQVVKKSGGFDSSQTIPKAGFDGQTAVHPNLRVNGSEEGRRAIVKHSVREMYYRTVEGMPYRQAHEKAGHGAFMSGTITIGDKKF